MPDSLSTYTDLAKTSTRNPLGIIALFIVLVYGMASLVTGVGSTLTSNERYPLVLFLTLFPPLVLGVFAWLVSQHSEKLYGPGDFKNEENYLKSKSGRSIALLAAASAKTTREISDAEIEELVRSVHSVVGRQKAKPAGWHRTVLWVDDRPENNIYERRAFEGVGISFVLSLDTKDALHQLSTQHFAAVISDMGRKEGPQEGYVLLDAMRKGGDKTPPIFLRILKCARTHTPDTTARGSGLHQQRSRFVSNGYKSSS